jgi:nucleoid-associated protein YgaU
MVQKNQNKLQSFDAYVSMALGLAAVLIIGAVVFNMVSKNKSGMIDQKAEESKKENNQAVSLPANHTVKAGETLWTIAQEYYQSGYNWTDIASANNLKNPDDIHVGNTIIIPSVTAKSQTLGQVTETAATEKKPEAKTYTVVAGDNLWKIAVASYNDGYRWVEIAKANNLTNPDIIHPGNVLTLP